MVEFLLSIHLKIKSLVGADSFEQISPGVSALNISEIIFKLWRIIAD